ncbi:uncharacterized protein B0P05DRAFT_475852, partial [Gilbertella persicaria]|uniref:uncharacterized protein n=1 Tax=Gilbertella persicaria TaxID=101096 RepID=UPI00221FEDB4
HKYKENNQGHIVNEHGFESMELCIDKELFAIKTISSCTQFLQNKPSERSFSLI